MVAITSHFLCHPVVNTRLPLGLVDVGAAFAQVELGLLLVEDALDLEQSGVLVLVTQTTLVSCEDSLGVEPAGRNKG